MKDYPYVPGWRLNKNSNKPRVKTSVLMLTKHGIAEGEWDGSDWVQYRWSCIVKDSDVLYWIHLEDLTQLEKEGDDIKKEQSEVDLERDAVQFCFDKGLNVTPYQAKTIAHHFYKLGLNARKDG